MCPSISIDQIGKGGVFIERATAQLQPITTANNVMSHEIKAISLLHIASNKRPKLDMGHAVVLSEKVHHKYLSMCFLACIDSVKIWYFIFFFNHRSNNLRKKTLLIDL